MLKSLLLTLTFEGVQDLIVCAGYLGAGTIGILASLVISAITITFGLIIAIEAIFWGGVCGITGLFGLSGCGVCGIAFAGSNIVLFTMPTILGDIAYCCGGSALVACLTPFALTSLSWLGLGDLFPFAQFYTPEIVNGV